MEKEQKKKKLPIWAIILIVIAVIFVLGSLVGGDDETSTTNDDANKSSNDVTDVETSSDNDLVLEDGYTAKLDEYGVTYNVEGYVTNNSDKDYTYVQIEFTAYDSEGNTLGTCLDNNSGLEKGGRWKFNASCIENVDSIKSVKLKELSGY